MKESEKFVGGKYLHKKLGKVKVNSIHENSRVLVDVKEIDKGKGYDSDLGRYVGVKFRLGWMRGENYTYGTEHVVHIKELITKIN